MTNPTPCEGILFGFVVPIPAFPGYVLLNKVPTAVVPIPMIVVTTPTQEYIAETTLLQELILVLEPVDGSAWILKSLIWVNSVW